MGRPGPVLSENVHYCVCMGVGGERPVRCFHQGKITLTEQGTQNREKKVTVPEVIMESRTGERNISNPKPNGLRRACCGRERVK